MFKDHPAHYHQIRKTMGLLQKSIPETMKGFGALNAATMKDGALPAKSKELIALAIGITSRCDGCIAYHINDALKAGATAAEIEETIGVAILMGGGPSVVYGCEALEALHQFQEQE